MVLLMIANQLLKVIMIVELNTLKEVIMVLVRQETLVLVKVLVSILCF